MEGLFVSQSTIAADKIEAYLHTDYYVLSGDGSFSLRIGLRSDPLLQLYADTRLRHGLFITAYNPFGQRQPDDANDDAHARLGEKLRFLTDHVFEAVGRGISGDWPGEKSYLALGIDRQTARELGLGVRQDAVVWAGEDAIPELLLLR